MALDGTLLGNPNSFSGDPSAMTLFEYARQSNSPMVKAIIRSIYLTGNVNQDIPYKTMRTIERAGERYTGASMPRVDYVPFNQDPIGSTASPEPYRERVWRVLNEMDHDVIFDEDENGIPGWQEEKAQLMMDSWAIKANDYFINNNHATGDTNAPIGLKARLADATARIPSDLIVAANGGSGIDLSSSSSNIGLNANLLMLAIDNMFTAMGNKDGSGTVIYGAGIGINQISFALRNLPQGGGWRITTDNYDREIEKYRQAKITDLGRKIDQQTPVISVSEDVNGNIVNGGKYTSLYFVRYGASYFSGWHFRPPQLGPVMTKPNTVTKYRVLRYEHGYWVPNTRAIGRISGVKIIPG